MAKELENEDSQMMEESGGANGRIEKGDGQMTEKTRELKLSERIGLDLAQRDGNDGTPGLVELERWQEQAQGLEQKLAYLEGLVQSGARPEELPAGAVAEIPLLLDGGPHLPQPPGDGTG